MPVFVYKGVSNSKNVSGTIDADSEKAARSKLRKQKIYPTSIKVEGTASGLAGKKLFDKITVQDVANMTRQLSVLLGASIPLIDALAAAQDQVEHQEIRKALSDIKEKVSEGGRLADSMQNYPDIFDSIYINMVKAGEASGSLDVVLDRLADYKEAQAELKQRIKSAMTYPIIMVIVAVGLVIYLFTSVIPKITKLFEKQKGSLPWATEVVIDITNFIQAHWFMMIILTVSGILGLLYYKKTAKGIRKIAEAKLKMPKVKELTSRIAVARFARTLSTLLNSGVQLLPALEIVKKVMDNVVLEEVIESAMVDVKEGEALYDSLKKTGIFPTMFLHMIAVGEKTGMLEQMLERVADTYDKEVEYAIDGMTSLITPFMLVFMGGIILFIVIAVLMPIMEFANMQ